MRSVPGAVATGRRTPLACYYDQRQTQARQRRTYRRSLSLPVLTACFLVNCSPTGRGSQNYHFAGSGQSFASDPERSDLRHLGRSLRFSLVFSRSCTLGRRRRTLGKRRRTLGRRLCTLGRRRCTLGRRRCTLGRRSHTLGRRRYTLGRRRCRLGRRPYTLGRRRCRLGRRSRTLGWRRYVGKRRCTLFQYSLAACWGFAPDPAACFEGVSPRVRVANRCLDIDAAGFV